MTNLKSKNRLFCVFLYLFFIGNDNAWLETRLALANTMAHSGRGESRTVQTMAIR